MNAGWMAEIEVVVRSTFHPRRCGTGLRVLTVYRPGGVEKGAMVSYSEEVADCNDEYEKLGVAFAS